MAGKTLCHPPTNESRCVHWVKIGVEKYIIYNMKRGNSEPVYEKIMLRALGIKRLDS